MKHAFLITAYNYPRLLCKLIEAMNHANFFFYIHVDEKNKKLFDDDCIKQIEALPNVTFIKNTVKVNWGAFSHSQAILNLLKEAFQNKEIDSFHTLSGQDFPIHSPEYLLHFFEQEKGKEFMINKPVPTPTWKGDQGRDRYQYYHYNERLDPKIGWQQKMIRALVLGQKFLFIKRPAPVGFEQLYGGHVWWSLSKDCVAYMLSYLEENPAFLERFRNTHCSEEIIFQTIVMNSPYAPNVVNDNLRYYVMQGSSPKVLEAGDYDKVIESGKLFMRKISAESALLIEKIKRSWKEETGSKIKN